MWLIFSKVGVQSGNINVQSGTVTIARLIPGEEIATDAGVPHFMCLMNS